MIRKKHSICFVDDDPQELRRFHENLQNDFVIVVGTSISEAMDKLRDQGVRKPDLFLLDMYYPEGPKSTEDELRVLASARQEFLEAQAKFASVLAGLRQSSRGGFNLARDVRKQYRTGFAFFTRKGTLEDAIQALDAGALRVIKKPDPNQSELHGNALPAAYDLAFKSNARNVVRDIEDALRRSSWWWKHKGAVFAYSAGFLTSLAAGYVLYLILKF